MITMTPQYVGGGVPMPSILTAGIRLWGTPSSLENS